MEAVAGADFLFACCSPSLTMKHGFQESCGITAEDGVEEVV
jgi:hypothetical protein